VNAEEHGEPQHQLGGFALDAAHSERVALVVLHYHHFYDGHLSYLGLPLLDAPVAFYVDVPVHSQHQI
jgi:hypothetical protein